MSDVVERAKAALEGLAEAGLVIREPCSDGASYTLLGLAQHAARNAVYDVVPELVAEVERLRRHRCNPPGWRVKVDDRTVLAVTDTEIAPKPAQLPPERFWTRARRWVSARTRSAADKAAGRLGYRRDDECGWDE